MSAILLPSSADPADVTLNVFRNRGGVQPEEYVVPLSGLLGAAAGAGSGQSGEVVLVAGVATVAATNVTATSRIFLSRRLVGGTAGFMGFTRNAGVGFSITNSSNADTSTVEYLIVG